MKIGRWESTFDQVTGLFSEQRSESALRTLSRKRQIEKFFLPHC
jgi:hypothetical protein